MLPKMQDLWTATDVSIVQGMAYSTIYMDAERNIEARYDDSDLNLFDGWTMNTTVSSTQIESEIRLFSSTPLLHHVNEKGPEAFT